MIRLALIQEEEAKPSARKLRGVSMGIPSATQPLIPRISCPPVRKKVDLFVPAPSLTEHALMTPQNLESSHGRIHPSRGSGTGYCTTNSELQQEYPFLNLQSNIALLRIFLDYLVAVRASTWGHVLSSEHVELYILLWSSLETSQQEEGKNALLGCWVNKDAATAAAQHVLFILERYGLFSLQQLSKPPAA